MTRVKQLGNGDKSTTGHDGSDRKQYMEKQQIIKVAFQIRMVDQSMSGVGVNVVLLEKLQKVNFIKQSYPFYQSKFQVSQRFKH